MPDFDKNLLISAARIDGILLDVDEVLTDGKITTTTTGEEEQKFFTLEMEAA